MPFVWDEDAALKMNLVGGAAFAIPQLLMTKSTVEGCYTQPVPNAPARQLGNMVGFASVACGVVMTSSDRPMKRNFCKAVGISNLGTAAIHLLGVRDGEQKRGPSLSAVGVHVVVAAAALAAGFAK